MDNENLNKNNGKMDRRSFLQLGLRAAALVSVVSVTGYLANKSLSDDLVWQIDPYKCVQCGRCATDCVLDLSAVKCVHVYKMCGFCNLCGGYYRPQVKELNTAAENLLCPTKALIRTYVEDPYFKYEIDEALCNGCAKCVKGCGSFGNGSLHLQINQSICVNCNQCSIAEVCPAEAIVRIPANKAYMLKDGWKIK